MRKRLRIVVGMKTKLCWTKWAGGGESGYDRVTDEHIAQIWRGAGGFTLYIRGERISTFATDTQAKREAEAMA